MYAVSYQYGGAKGKKFKLVESDAHLVVRTHSRRATKSSSISSKAHAVLDDYSQVALFPEAGVEILECRKKTTRKAIRDAARKVLKKEKDVQFAGRVLIDPNSKRPVLYTQNFFVKFSGNVKPAECKRKLKAHGLTIKREISYAKNSYFVSAADDAGMKTFKIAESLINDPAVDLCHPELIRKVSRRQVFAPQWHLRKTNIGGTVVNQHANVETAWDFTKGEGATIAVIDDGVDTGHEEFTGSGKIAFARDVTRGVDGAQPVFFSDRHGTACAGVAAANGNHGASGVAPKSNLMPIRLRSALGSQDEADAFFWAASHGADVISCSWGPEDGDWWDNNDPTHNQVVPLPDSTRLAIDWAVNNGRNGKGCIITWAAGNGHEPVENDGYASYEKVVAVAACNDRGEQALYSDFGPSVWCAFPSNHGDSSITPGIWTTDLTGPQGYNEGSPQLGDAAGNYTNSFGGTSSACPGAAGVAALVVSRNPDLRWDGVKDIMKRCCDRIDSQGGGYDANGHSNKYGYGRLNARKAVMLAVPKSVSLVTQHRAFQDVAIKDHQTSKLSVNVGDTKPIKAVVISVDIEHTWRGDLALTLKPPTSAGGRISLYQGNRGDEVDNLKTTFDALRVPGLDTLTGSNPSGKWTLEVLDRANQDQGKIRSFGVELTF